MSNCSVEYHWDYNSNKLIKENNIGKIVQNAIKDLDFCVDHVALIFVDDNYLKNLHEKYLDDPSFTDVMTFDLRDEESQDIEIYISVDTAKKQANDLNVPVQVELLRYVLHGILHIAGYTDKNQEDLAAMKKVENELVQKFAPMINLKKLDSE